MHGSRRAISSATRWPADPIVIRGDGRAVRSYLHAADLMIWLLTLLLRGKPGRAYNVGSDAGLTVGELAQAVARPGQAVTRAAAGAGDAACPPQRYLPDIARARDELGLTVLIPLDDAIERTLRWNPA
jgi:nucleoside-diphosphate-sugar epimerase